MFIVVIGISRSRYHFTIFGTIERPFIKTEKMLQTMFIDVSVDLFPPSNMTNF